MFRQRSDDGQLTPVSVARSMAVDLCSPLPALDVDTRDSLGLVVAVDAVAIADVPAFDNSSMDGFALRAADLGPETTTLRLTPVIEAGSSRTRVELPPGSAAPIMTGASMPTGADSVIAFERVDHHDDRTVTMSAAVVRGDNVRRKGSDTTAGVVVVPAGRMLRPTHLAALTACRSDTVTVHRRPRVAVITTGAELNVDSATAIPDSNREYLAAALRERNFEISGTTTATDDLDALTRALRTAAAHSDAVITTGGVGPGQRDLVPGALRAIGQVRELTVAMKPGKPFAIGSIDVDGRKVPVFCLPGNPVSTMVSFELLVWPALRRLAGVAEPRPLTVDAVTTQPIEHHDDGKTHYVRARLHSDGDATLATPAMRQGSHHVVSSSEANCLIEIADGRSVTAGESVTVHLLGVTDDH